MEAVKTAPISIKERLFHQIFNKASEAAPVRDDSSAPEVDQEKVTKYLRDETLEAVIR